MLCCKDTGEHLADCSRGLDTLIQNCTVVGRQDIVEVVSGNRDHKHHVHPSCRRSLAYDVRKSRKSTDVNLDTSRRQTRSSTGPFSFRDHCFLCGDSVYGSKDARKVLGGTEFDDSIRRAIAERKDDWSDTVQGRLSSISDLFSADAIYHRSCHSRFMSVVRHTPHKSKRGRPQKNDAMAAFDRLCDKLESKCSNDRYTLSELHDMMHTMISSDDDSQLYSKLYLKHLLTDRYGDHIYFASRHGRDDVVGFKNFCDLLLHGDFFASRNEGGSTEAERTVQKAAGLLLAEIREMPSNRDFYPTADNISADPLTYLPPLLKGLLHRLIRPPLQQAAIGQALVQAARPHGTIMPLPFAVGIDLDKSGNRQLTMKLARLGFSVSYDEVRRYKQSVLEMLPTPDSSLTLPLPDDVSNVPFTCFVADNVDHNIRTLDGYGTFHGMGLISATVQQGGYSGIIQQKVPRTENVKSLSTVTNFRQMHIHACPYTFTEGLKQITYINGYMLLKPIQLDSMFNLSTLWLSVGLISRTGQPRPNWSGYMQTVCIC